MRSARRPRLRQAAARIRDWRAATPRLAVAVVVCLLLDLSASRGAPQVSHISRSAIAWRRSRTPALLAAVSVGDYADGFIPRLAPLPRHASAESTFTNSCLVCMTNCTTYNNACGLMLVRALLRRLCLPQIVLPYRSRPRQTRCNGRSCRRHQQQHYGGCRIGLRWAQVLLRQIRSSPLHVVLQEKAGYSASMNFK